MATIVLAAAGAAVGSGFGGAVLGLSGAVIGRAVGATLGRALDQRLLGAGGGAVETGRVERFRLTGAREGADLPLIWGRMRVGGQVIWASRFQETRITRRSGKLSGRQDVEFTYSVSLALALGEGPIRGIGRIWADGVEIGRDGLTLRVYPGDEDQLPDPRMEAVEGVGRVPAYRGTAYVVLEDLELGRWGNRVPQFAFEVLRSAEGADDMPALVRAVAMIPGTGEYALASEPVTYRLGPGEAMAANQSGPSGLTDLQASLEQLQTELPRSEAVGLIVSWFGDDLRCGECALKPKVEKASPDGQEMAWRVSGLARAAAEIVPEDDDGRVVYGGTPADAAVVQAIQAIHARGQTVMFYPFLLMEQMAGNGLPDPYSDAPDQPVLPWRGRITLSVAPGRDASPDRSAAAEAEVAAFFGSAQPGQFTTTGTRVDYTGPEDWGLRRMILHYAHLCAAAGGVEAFCIGSEFRGLTTIRGAGDSFPAVDALRALAADVRAILGPETKITYAADWTEYAGYDAGGGNRYFHLDPLWADENIDVVGIDNYLPVADWRDGDDHADAGFETIHDPAYLAANVLGGEYFDWFYPDDQARIAQRREPIEDGAHGEPWVFRIKDLRGWWENAHHDRIAGVRAPVASPWVPQSKPIWFTELGCAAIDKGANEPNKFLDPKSSESRLPVFSDGRRDDLMQLQYLRAVLGFWDRPENNPVSEEYDGRMLETDRSFIWAWDARPFPEFPTRTDIWADGENWLRGHWLNGRTLGQPLDAVVREICLRAGLEEEEIDVSALHGLVRGYAVASADSGRSALQGLMLVHGFDAVERGGRLVFLRRARRALADLDPDWLALPSGWDSAVTAQRAAAPEVAGRVRLGFLGADGDYETRSVEAVLPDERGAAASASEVPMLLTPAEGRALAGRWLAEARIARDSLRFALPPSSGLQAGDVVTLRDSDWRIDRLELGAERSVEAVRVERGLYAGADEAEELAPAADFVPPVQVTPQFLDLPLMRGDEIPHAPHLAVAAEPWPGLTAVHVAPLGDGEFVLNRLVAAPNPIGVTQTELDRAAPVVWDRAAPLRVRLRGAGFASASDQSVRDGANLVAIGDGSPEGWELMQFATAELVAPDVWELSRRLRGLFGSDARMPDVWPAGSLVVPVSPELGQVALSLDKRGLAQRWRIGPASRTLDHPLQVEQILSFSGLGLRPYAPAHLRARRLSGGSVAVGWTRRTRIGGDSWEGPDVPLGEVAERYRLRVVDAAGLRRSLILSDPDWSYLPAMQAEDAVTLPFQIEVAQISDVVGEGDFARVQIDD